MEFIRSQVCCVFLFVIIVLYCVDLARSSEGDIILANIGDDITLSCSESGVYSDNYKWWYRNGTLLANWIGVFINDPRFTQGVYQQHYRDSNKISISNIRMNDSATFKCSNYNNKTLRSYDLRVLTCFNCMRATHSNPDKINVSCTLEKYWTNRTLSGYIFLHRAYLPTAIEGNIFAFSIDVTELNRLPLEFELLIDGNEGRIKCMLPTQPTPPSFPMSTISTTSLKRTKQNRPSTLSYTALEKLPAGRSTSISTTEYHTPKNKNANSDKNTMDSNITLIIVILGSAFILILIVIIIVLRCKKTKDRQENKNFGNASIKKEHSEVFHESVKDGSRNGPEYATSIKELRKNSLGPQSADPPGNGEMIDNILYDFTEKIIDSSISRIEGPLDDALYAMPDKRATISRESKPTSKDTDRSSNSDHLYGNNAIITQHELNRGGGLQQGDQYENVKMPGSGGGAEEIPLYDMPDKGPTRNTLKTTPEAGQTSTLSRDEVVSVDVLYAEVDKTKKIYTNN